MYKIKLEQANKKHLSGDLQGALLLYKDLLNDNAGRVDKENILFHIGSLYLALGNQKEGVEVLEQLRTESNNVDILGGVNFKLANFYFDNNENIKAKIYVVEALKHPPKLYSLYLALRLAAKASYYNGDLVSAKSYFMQLYKNFPDDSYSQKVFSILDLLSTGNFYLQLGKFKFADNAKNLMTKLTILGYTAILKESGIIQEKFYLVLGVCKSKEICKKIKEELTRLDLDSVEIP